MTSFGTPPGAGGGNNRTAVTDTEVDRLVEARVSTLVNDEETFTAFSVISKLRDDNPTIEVSGAVVRRAVRDLMALNSDYDTRTRLFPGGQAIEYFPSPGGGTVGGVMQASPGHIQQLPSSGGLLYRIGSVASPTTSTPDNGPLPVVGGTVVKDTGLPGIDASTLADEANT